METYIPGIPGVRTTKTATHKVVFRGGFLPDALPQGRLVNGTVSRDPTNTGALDVLQPGVLMGKRTSDSFYAPSILGPTTAITLAGATTITAGAATVTELVRRVGATGTFTLVGPPAANGMVQSEVVTYSAASATSITCTATVNAYISGAFIMGTDGSQIPITFVPDGWGIKVTDVDGTTNVTAQFPFVPIGGMITAAQLVNWPTDTSLQRWIGERLSDASGGKFILDTAF